MAHKCTYNPNAVGVCENGNAFCNGKDAKIKSARLIIEVTDTNLNEARIEADITSFNWSSDLEGYNELRREANVPEYKSLAECHADNLFSELDITDYLDEDKIKRENHGPSYPVR